jgi:hypothetical protein
MLRLKRVIRFPREQLREYSESEGGNCSEMISHALPSGTGGKCYAHPHQSDG